MRVSPALHLNAGGPASSEVAKMPSDLFYRTRWVCGTSSMRLIERQKWCVQVLPLGEKKTKVLMDYYVHASKVQYFLLPP